MGTLKKTIENGVFYHLPLLLGLINVEHIASRRCVQWVQHGINESKNITPSFRFPSSKTSKSFYRPSCIMQYTHRVYTSGYSLYGYSPEMQYNCTLQPWWITSSIYFLIRSNRNRLVFLFVTFPSQLVYPLRFVEYNGTTSTGKYLYNE